ncbi:MAG TPA: D-2-hydroxyacid dehydrogenase [Candidatus Binatia bacterium]|nr:D-2-hydroxyacid dehydrogenase [Candidatus Binatia bacterium]
MTKVCISFAGASGLSGFPDFPLAAVQQLQAEFPNAQVVLTRTSEQRRAELVNADVLFAVRFSPEDFKIAKQLKWLHLSSAGATHVLFPEMIESDIIVTNSRGLYGIPIAEHVIGVMIVLARKLHEAYRFQLAGKWPRQEMFDRYPSFSELYGQTTGVVGLGDIGLAVAERVKALGMRVIATKRHVGTPPACVDEVLGPEGLPHLLQMSDFVVIAAPLTPETKGLIGERELRLMKPTAYIFNVGRGAIIQEAVLIRALKEGWIAGAGLDVTEVEPLPPESELFQLPNVFLTPHCSGLRSHYWEHAVAIFKPSLAKFLRGEPPDNLVDKRGGY